MVPNLAKGIGDLPGVHSGSVNSQNSDAEDRNEDVDSSEEFDERVKSEHEQQIAPKAGTSKTGHDDNNIIHKQAAQSKQEGIQSKRHKKGQSAKLQSVNDSETSQHNEGNEHSKSDS